MKIVNPRSGAFATASTSFVIAVPSHSATDRVALFVCLDAGTIATIDATFSLIVKDPYGDDLFLYEHIGTATQVAITTTVSTRITYHFAVIEKSLGVESFAVRGNSGSTAPLVLPSITTVTDNCLVLACTGNVGGTYVSLPDIDSESVNYATVSNYQIGTTLTSRYIRTAGASGAFKFHLQKKVNVAGIVVVFKDDGSADIPLYKDPSAILADLLFSSSSNRLYGDTGVNLRQNLTAETTGTGLIPDVNGEATISTDTPGAKTVSGYSYRDAGYALLSLSANSAGGVNKPIVEAIGLPIAKNLSGKIIQYYPRVNNYPTSDMTAAYFGVSDGTNAKLFSVWGSGIIPDIQKTFYPFLIELSALGNELQAYGAGSVNDSAITAFVFGYKAYDTYKDLRIPPIYILETFSVIGGTAANPKNMNDVKVLTDGSMLNIIQTQSEQSSSQFYITGNLKVGDGVAGSTHFSGFGQTLEFPAASTANRRQSMISQAALSFEINVNGVINLPSFVFNMGDYHKFIHTSGTVTGSILVLNPTPVLNTVLSNATFSQCKEVQFGLNSVLHNNTFSNCVDPQVITITSPAEYAKLANCTFDNNNIAILITGNQSGSWSDANLTMSGNTVDISYTGTTAFKIQSANAMTKDNALLTIAVPHPTLTITGLVNGSILVLHDLDNVDPQNKGTELLRNNNTAGDVAYTGTAGNLISISVYKSGYRSFYSEYTISTTSASFTVNQLIETN